VSRLVGSEMCIRDRHKAVRLFTMLRPKIQVFTPRNILLNAA
jgi:hypothetical protein